MNEDIERRARDGWYLREVKYSGGMEIATRDVLPLSDSEIGIACTALGYGDGDNAIFMEGVRFAERHHKVAADK